MTSNLRHHNHRPALPASSAGVLAASIAAAAIVGLLTFVQSASLGVQTPAPVGADGAPQHSAADPLDAGVDWRRVEPAPEPDGASVAAYER